MPYRVSSDLPPSVRNHLPEHAQDIYREAFNHASRPMPANDREKRAHMIAWAAVKRSYVKSAIYGYTLVDRAKSRRQHDRIGRAPANPLRGCRGAGRRQRPAPMATLRSAKPPQWSPPDHRRAAHGIGLRLRHRGQLLRFDKPVHGFYLNRFCRRCIDPAQRVKRKAYAKIRRGAYLNNSRIARSRPSNVSGYIRPPINWRTIWIE